MGFWGGWGRLAVGENDMYSWIFCCEFHISCVQTTFKIFFKLWSIEKKRLSEIVSDF